MEHFNNNKDNGQGPPQDEDKGMMASVGMGMTVLELNYSISLTPLGHSTLHCVCLSAQHLVMGAYMHLTPFRVHYIYSIALQLTSMVQALL